MSSKKEIEAFRDRAAMAVMPALLSELYASSIRQNQKFENIFKAASEAAYEIADEMLLARKSKDETR